MLTIALMLAAGSFSASSNFSVDLLGEIDTRPDCWGRADYRVWAVTFKPPVGYRVRIVSLRGDLLAWPRVLDGEQPVERGKTAGVLIGFQTTANEGSERCDWCADNTFLYLQGATSNGDSVRIPFDVTVDRLLEPDHKLIVKVASWLNTTGRHIHLEPTFTTTYKFEKDP